MKTNTIEELKLMNPCKEGLDWALKQQTLVDVWDKCPRSDWMWWLLQHLDKCPKELSIKYSKWCADSVAHLRNRYVSASDAAYSADAANDADGYAYAAYAAAAAAAYSAYAYSVAYSAVALSASADAAASASDAAASVDANAAAYAATAASASAVYSAAASVDAAAVAASAAVRNISRKKQADYLRSIVENPFL
jgi:hypothetical protein